MTGRFHSGGGGVEPGYCTGDIDIDHGEVFVGAVFVGADFRHDTGAVNDEVEAAEGIGTFLEDFGGFGVVRDIVGEGEYSLGIFFGKELEAIGSAGDCSDKATAFGDLASKFGTDSTGSADDDGFLTDYFCGHDYSMMGTVATVVMANTATMRKRATEIRM